MNNAKEDTNLISKMIRNRSLSILAMLLLVINPGAWATGPQAMQITIGEQATPLETYAARELQRYLYQISGTFLEINKAAGNVSKPPSGFILGQRATNPAIELLANQGRLGISPADPGPQGYVLKKINMPSGGETIVIAGSDAAGSMYGVYGLLSDHYGIGFYFSGDTFPVLKKPLRLVAVDERKAPAVSIRGFLPWTNFPQSATSYSWEDWKYIIDQAARMRMNFIHVHNYSGQGGVGGHNEMFANFTLHGFISRVWMATARSGHRWSGPGWEPARYRFGAAEIFDDYDFGADCALHNETLTSEQVFRKGVGEFQKVIAYAHRRGVRIGLGLDIDLIPLEYKADAVDPAVVQARVAQISTDYPDLDYLLCFQSENIARDEVKRVKWRRIFDAFYDNIKNKALPTRIAVSGWGLAAKDVATLPPDVICAPISAYRADFELGAIYGQREYWGCPWLEKDGDGSQYYYPYNVNLSNTIRAWRERFPNMKGFYCLTWRLTDAINPKISAIAELPWDAAGRYATSEAAYRCYAEKNYGTAAASAVTEIINENEPIVGPDQGECRPTPPFTAMGWRKVPAQRRDELEKAVAQIAAVDRCIRSASSPTDRARLRMLRARLAAARDHIELNLNFATASLDDLSKMMASWVYNFMSRINDISSLGNIISIQNRYVQLNYEPREAELRPRAGDHSKAGLDEKLNLPSYAAPFQIIMVSPPTSAPEGEPVWIKARLLDLPSRPVAHIYPALSRAGHRRLASLAHDSAGSIGFCRRDSRLSAYLPRPRVCH